MFISLLAVASLAAAAPAALPPGPPVDLVANGGFEAGLDGWTADGWEPAASGGAIAAFAGDGFASTSCIGHLCTLSQDIATVAGQRYTLSYAYNPGEAANGSALFVNWDGVERQAHFGGPLGWITQRLGGLVATGPSTTISFSGLQSATFDGLDGVSVVNSIPEPESWTLMIIGVAVVGVSMRTRRGVVVAA